MPRRFSLAHALSTGQPNFPIQIHGENPPTLPAARKGKGGRLLRRPQQAHPAATVADFRTAVLKLNTTFGSVFGRDLAQAQTFGIAPDPTAVASLGLIELVKAGRWILPLSIIPVSWCLFSGVTLMTLNAPEGWLLISALGVWLASRLAAFREPETNE